MLNKDVNLSLCLHLQAGTCWVVLNIYPLEQSLRKLANMFGAISSNRENIMVFNAMLKSVRFTFDHEELVRQSRWQISTAAQFQGGVSQYFGHLMACLSNFRIACCLIPQETAMQVFQCHYQEGSLVSGLYFDYIKDVLHAASQGTSGFACKPPPCLNPQQTPGTISHFAFTL